MERRNKQLHASFRHAPYAMLNQIKPPRYLQLAMTMSSGRSVSAGGSADPLQPGLLAELREVSHVYKKMLTRDFNEFAPDQLNKLIRRIQQLECAIKLLREAIDDI